MGIDAVGRPPANADIEGTLSRLALGSPIDGAADMNPANFNVGGGMPGGAMPQMHMPQNNHDGQVIFNHAVQALQSQQFTGWKKEVPIQERAMKVYQM